MPKLQNPATITITGINSVSQIVVYRMNHYTTLSEDHRYLLGHRVNHTPILPGTFVIAPYARAGFRLQNIKFLEMVLLEPLPSSIDIAEVSNGSMRCVVDGSDTPFATFDFSQASEFNTETHKSPVAMQAGSALNNRGDSLYRTLALRGNHYAGSFLGIQSYSQTDAGLEGIWSVENLETPTTGNALVTALIDSCTHLAAISDAGERGFLLSGLGEITFHSDDEPSDNMHIRVSARADKESEFDVDIQFPDGVAYASLKGLSLQFTTSGDESTIDYQLAIAASFTADPLLDINSFWNEKIGFNIGLELAEYGQVLQSMLGVNNAFKGPADNHLCLLRLEDLANQSDNQSIADENETRRQLLVNSAHDTVDLPDGRTIASLNPYESQYLYREIYEDLSYYKNDVAILDNDTIIDVGANIGLFSIFAYNEAENLKVFSVEPSPVVFPILRANLDTYAPTSIAIQAGASDSRGEAQFTAYKHSSVFSSFDADDSTDESAIKAIVRNQIEESGISDPDVVDAAVEDFLKGRMDSETFTCKLLSLSDIIDQYELTQIGLLKVDAEKSENQIIAGIRDEHWPLIEQMIIEVHTQAGSSAEPITKLLQSKGFEVLRDEEMLLEESGLINLYAIRPSRLARNQARYDNDEQLPLIDSILDAARAHAASTHTPLDIVFCPPSSQLISRGRLRKLEDLAIERISALPNSQGWLWNTYCESYPVSDVLDPLGNTMGHIPYSIDWYTATATALYRRSIAKSRKPYKVIAVDCDNTLWSGVVGEAGAENIVIGPQHQQLHRLLKRKVSEGMLVCLVSKNNQDEVFNVFDKRSDFLLTRDDIVAHDINWDPKHITVKRISNALNLGLDSFVFLDDSALEIAQMREFRPEVLSVQMPEDAHTFSKMLDHIWALDGASATREDADRTQMYRQESERHALKQTNSSMEDFINALQLKTEFLDVDNDIIPRASQMTMRTNQFNTTTLRWSESDIRSIVDDKEAITVIKVTDKFGDYGITGLFTTQAHEGSLRVRLFLLSCRVLGRGVEHAAIRHLADIAEKQHLDSIRLDFAHTEKNKPALAFLERLPGEPHTTDVGQYKLITTTDAKNLTFSSDQDGAETNSEGTTTQTASIDDNNIPDKTAESRIPRARNPGHQVYPEIALTLSNVSQIRAQSLSVQLKARPELETPYTPPETEMQSTIVSIWSDILGIESIGINDNFFELGGSSLRAVQMIAALQKKLERSISVVKVFEASTVSELATILEQDSGERAEKMSAVKNRGAERRAARGNRRQR